MLVFKNATELVIKCSKGYFGNSLKNLEMFFRTVFFSSSILDFFFICLFSFNTRF